VILIVDANVIVSNPFLRGSVWEQLAEAVPGQRLEVLIPRFALDEAIAVFARRRRAKSVEIQAVGRHASRAVRAHLDKARRAAERESAKYPKQLRKRLEAIGIAVIAPPTTGHHELVSRAIQRRRPFDDNGSGYRDALHWMSVLDVVGERYEESDIAFVSADRRAFGATAKDDVSLHPDLIEDLQKYDAAPPYFLWIRSLDQFNVPGVFHEDLQVAYQLTVKAGEIAGFVQSALWDSERLDLLPRQLALPTEPTAVTVLDIREPKVDGIRVRQYFEEERFRVDFELVVDLELALQSVHDSGGLEAVEEVRSTISFVTSAHADIDVGPTTDALNFSNLEVGELHAASRE
jgi:hypothetical protein